VAYGSVLEPVNLVDQRSVFKLGSTVPVKFKLTCANQPITDAVANLSTKGTFDGGAWTISAGTWRLIIELDDGKFPEGHITDAA
jgi:hypothetical protein